MNIISEMTINEEMAFQVHDCVFMTSTSRG